MTVFYYKATNQQGQFVEGNIEAPDARAAAENVRRLNYYPVQVSEHKIASGFNLDLKLPAYFNRTTPKELLILTQQLGTLVNSGITLDESLASVSRLTEKETTRKMIAGIHQRVHAGSAFADALAEHPGVFSKLYVNMIRAGEAGGLLGESLNRLADFLEKAEDLKQNIRSAMTYPCILIFFSLCAVVFMFSVVIPKFSTLFEDSGHVLPLVSRIMLGTSTVIVEYGWLILLLTLAVVFAFAAYIRSERGRKNWDAFLLKVPLLGDLIRKVEVSRFSLTMATLLKSGVAVLPALNIVRTILSNQVILSAMGPLHQGLKGGKGLSGPLKQTGVFPAMAVHMITVGEASGKMEEMLLKVSQTYDKEVERSIKRIISLIEPLLIAFMAIVVGFIVISMLLAIFSINEINF